MPGPALIIAEHGADAEARPSRGAGASAAPTACGTSARTGARGVFPSRRSTYSWSNMVRPPARVLAHGFPERQVRPRVPGARQRDPALVFATSAAGRARDRCRTRRRAADARDARQRGREIALARQRLQHAVGGDHEPEAGAGAERQVADVAADEAGAVDASPARRAFTRARASIASDRSTPTSCAPISAAAAPAGRCRIRAREPCPACRPARPCQNADVAPGHGAGVLPVVKRGVLVPALPAFAHVVNGC